MRRAMIDVPQPRLILASAAAALAAALSGCGQTGALYLP
ncbi:MAG: lipoprotein, partial [Ottowia sp.]|nr:lipoprotein [Ottowia sp.]